MNKHAGLAASLITAAVLLSACGGGSTNAPASSPANPSGTRAPAASSTPTSSTAASPQPSTGVSVPANAAKIGDSIQYDDKVEVTITQFENSGDHTTLTVEINNKASEDFEGPVDVQASYGNNHLAAPPATTGTPISLPIAAGKKSNGKYVFTVPKSGRGKLAVDIALGTDRDHAQFLGSVK